MDELLVLVGGITAIAWINWYFFVASRGNVVAANVAGSTQEIDVQVEGGYEPSTIRVERGKPVRISFDRTESSNCSEEVVFPDFEVRRYLPSHEKTTVEITPEKTGEFEFTCGMGMLRGRLIVEDS